MSACCDHPQSPPMPDLQGMPCPLWVARSTTSDNEADSNTYKRLFTGHLYKLRSSQAQTIFGPAKALGPKE